MLSECITSIYSNRFILKDSGLSFKKDLLFIKHQCVGASCMPGTEDLALNPGMGPDWELNQRPFGSQDGTQSTEPHQPRQDVFLSDN